LSLVLLVLALAAVGFVADLGQLASLASAFDRRLIIPVFLLAPANYVFRYYKWTILLSRAAVRIPRGLSLGVFLAGLSMTITPAKAGELIKAHYLKEAAGIPYEKSVPVVVGERVLDSASVVILALAGVVGGSALSRYGPWIAGLSAAGLAAAVLFLRSTKGPAWLAGLARRFGGIGRRLAVFIEEFGAGSRLVLDGRTFAWCTLIGVVSWALEGLIVNLTLAGLGYDCPPLLGVSVVALASLAGAASMLPGGAGAAEATLMGLLLVYGYPVAVAGLATLVTRLATLWLGVAVGAVALAVVEARLSRESRGHRLPTAHRC